MKAIVLGLNHNIQRRHPEETRNVEESRQRFLAGLQRLIPQQGIHLVAEEAGDDREAAEHLQRAADGLYSFAGLTAPRIPVQETAARAITRERGLCGHIDIRPPGPKSNEEEYERQMAERILASTGADQTVLVLCGEDHREALAGLLSAGGCETEDHPFEWLENSNQGRTN